MLSKFKDKEPLVAETAFVADSAEIIGDVVVGDHSSIWFNAVIRGDMDRIQIGNRTSIQDNSVIHTDPPLKVEIGDDVTVGHGAVLHSCRIGNNVLIGMNSTVLDGVEIGENSIVGANALVPPGKKFPANSVITGVPGKVRREANPEDVSMIKENAAAYVELAAEYKKQQKS
ncbi:Carbonic anhydrase or acetyltransferase, isoleucine patch superfamily [Methanococcoides vulcani]|uniref:Carbonic anhydrase or acetyltransferase, isoleucine patch superfamily n=1 Tax=Methanococcoides vulcani TaxID=1353158 RepID=A0A1H9YJE1_9EURY|nr:gamma carbonic anhydrase family protein [Methanococcoides vulcani]SES69179.1 Carbonic anhydrase or acetyltransferase, isoleucine patch superfamily [Methanococcoides vulcani]